MQTEIKIKQLIEFCKSMSNKEILGSYHGSVSSRIDIDQFIINKKNASFNNLQASDLLELFFLNDYSWREASIDASIHTNIYKHFPEAKFITIAYPLFTNSYAIHHSHITPIDYHGYKTLKSIKVYDPKNYDDWGDRASSEILQYFLHNDTNMIVIKGYGVCIYSRELSDIAKKLAILEYSSKLLMLDKTNNLTP